MTNVSLRFKLTLWFLAFFVIVYVGFLAVARVMHRSTLRDSLDRRLAGLAEGVADRVSLFDEYFSTTDLRLIEPIDPQYTVVAVRNELGHVISFPEHVDTLALPPLPETEAINTPHPIEGETAMRLIGRPIVTRMVTHRATPSAERMLYIDLAATIDLRDEERSFLYDLLILGGIGALIASAFAAWMLAGRAVAPFERLTEAARKLKEGEGALQLTGAARDREVEGLRSELNEALSRLRDNYRARERFLANVAHELKTPVSVMLTESQVLRPDTATREALLEFRRSMEEELRRLSQLISGVLALGRADEAPELARRSLLSVNDLILDSVAACSLYAQACGVNVEPELIDPDKAGRDAEIMGDPDLLAAMLINIIRNAVRYSPRGESVHVDAEIVGNDARIVVRDDGPGIPETYLDKVFERFAQGPPDNRRSEGTGLGLAIARTVAESHGGTITARNRQSGGCAFTISLPLTGGRGTLRSA